MTAESRWSATKPVWLVLLLAACGGTPAIATGPAPTQAVAATVAATAAATSGAAPEGPSLQTIIGASPPPVPVGTMWLRIADDSGAFTFEVPSTWTEHQTVPWTEASGTSSGYILVAGPKIGVLGSDFTQPGVAIGISTNPDLRTPRQVVDADDYKTFCTGTPAADETGTGYVAAYRLWTSCGGREDAFIIVIVIALLASIFQGAGQADMGYIEHMLGSIQTDAGVSAETAAPAPPTAAPGNAQGWTATVDECLSQIGDAIAIGTITNVDTRSHAYRVNIRFLSEGNLLIGDDYWDTPPLDPSQGYRYQIRHSALNGTKLVTCTLSSVQILD